MALVISSAEEYVGTTTEFTVINLNSGVQHNKMLTPSPTAVRERTINESLYYRNKLWALKAIVTTRFCLLHSYHCNYMI